VFAKPLLIIIFVVAVLSCQRAEAQVEVDMLGDDLIVFGGFGDDAIVIRATVDSGTFLIEGIDGTRVNGKRTLVFDQVGEVYVDLFQGDNRIKLTHETIDGVDAEFEIENLQIYCAGGEDLVLLDQVDLDGSLTIKTGAGRDYVRAGTSLASIGGEALIAGGAQRDVIQVSNYDVEGDLTLAGGTGPDTIYFHNSDVLGNPVADGGAGFDTVGISFMRVPLATLSVFGRKGVDSIYRANNSLNGYEEQSIESEMTIVPFLDSVQSHPLYDDYLDLIQR
jgi:hypothetical protein